MRRALPELLPLFTPEGQRHDRCATAHSLRQECAGRGRQERRWLESVRDRGGGKRSPSPQAASPNGESHHGPVQGSPPAPPRIRLLTRYRHALPTPPPGRGRSAAGAGGVGVLARSKMVGVWETGEGEQVPPPRQPLPQWRYPPRSSTWGDPGEKPGTVAHRLHPGYGCPPDIATHCPRPRRGRGRSAAGAGGVGVPKECVAISCRRRRGWGGGCRRGV